MCQFFCAAEGTLPSHSLPFEAFGLLSRFCFRLNLSIAIRQCYDVTTLHRGPHCRCLNIVLIFHVDRFSSFRDKADTDDRTNGRSARAVCTDRLHGCIFTHLYTPVHTRAGGPYMSPVQSHCFVTQRMTSFQNKNNFEQ